MSKRKKPPKRTPRGKWNSAQPEFKRQVLLRSKGNCEINACKNPGRHIHHITYQNVPNDTVADVTYLCWECHCRAHGRPIYHSSDKPVSTKRVWLSDEEFALKRERQQRIADSHKPWTGKPVKDWPKKAFQHKDWNR